MAELSKTGQEDLRAGRDPRGHVVPRPRFLSFGGALSTSLLRGHKPPLERGGPRGWGCLAATEGTS